MKILKSKGNYVVHHDDGTTSPARHDWEVWLDGVLQRGNCYGADADEGWCDLFVRDDGTPEGSVRPIPGSGSMPAFFRIGADNKPEIRRVFGRVEIRRREASLTFNSITIEVDEGNGFKPFEAGRQPVYYELDGLRTSIDLEVDGECAIKRTITVTYPKAWDGEGEVVVRATKA